MHPTVAGPHTGEGNNARGSLLAQLLKGPRQAGSHNQTEQHLSMNHASTTDHSSMPLDT